MKRFLRLDIIMAAFFIFSCQAAVAQGSNVLHNKKFRYTRFIGVGGSSFDVNGYPSSPRYPSLELRLGAGIVRSMGKYLELKSGLNVGLKIKRESYYFGPSKQYTYQQGVMLSLDETASSRNHFFIEVPLALQYNPSKTRVGIKGGFNSRLWAPHNASVDVLTAKPELGMLGGISYHLRTGVQIGLEHYYGLTDIWGGSFFRNSQLITYYVRNQFTQLTLEFTFF